MATKQMLESWETNFLEEKGSDSLLVWILILFCPLKKKLFPDSGKLIARCLLKSAKILIFDEATSSLDIRNEKTIMEVLKKHQRNRTVLFVTHRLHLNTYCDSICIVDKKGVIEQGSHSSLLRTPNSHYSALWKTFLDKIPDSDIDILKELCNFT